MPPPFPPQYSHGLENSADASLRESAKLSPFLFALLLYVDHFSRNSRSNAGSFRFSFPRLAPSAIAQRMQTRMIPFRTFVARAIRSLPQEHLKRTCGCLFLAPFIVSSMSGVLVVFIIVGAHLAVGLSFLA